MEYFKWYTLLCFSSSIFRACADAAMMWFFKIRTKLLLNYQCFPQSWKIEVKLLHTWSNILEKKLQSHFVFLDLVGLYWILFFTTFKYYVFHLLVTLGDIINITKNIEKPLLSPKLSLLENSKIMGPSNWWKNYLALSIQKSIQNENYCIKFLWKKLSLWNWQYQFNVLPWMAKCYLLGTKEY